MTLLVKSLLMRLRDGNVSRDDWKSLLQHTPQHADNAHELQDAIRLFYTKESVAAYNFKKLQTLGTPVATIIALHSSAAAASALMMLTVFIQSHSLPNMHK